MNGYSQYTSPIYGYIYIFTYVYMCFERLVLSEIFLQMFIQFILDISLKALLHL